MGFTNFLKEVLEMGFSSILGLFYKILVFSLHVIHIEKLGMAMGRDQVGQASTSPAPPKAHMPRPTLSK